ncbi:MAG TPA: hypothetical protein VKY60_03070 [Burkholderiaceae bacterium]|jgi:hypothetical protein|nr:hypothetical protein [Burkholderiaceae bacterium]
MSSDTIDTAVARQMVAANAISGASIIGQPGGWSVMLKFGTVEKPLGTQRTDKPRIWRSLDTCIQYLRNELRITRVEMLDASNYSEEGNARARRDDAAERMRRAHEAAAHDAWVRAQVEAALDDSSPSLSHDQVMQEAQAIIDKALEKKKNARHAPHTDT